MTESKTLYVQWDLQITLTYDKSLITHNWLYSTIDYAPKKSLRIRENKISHFL